MAGSDVDVEAGKPWKTVSSGSGEPRTTPDAIGDVYVDTAALKIWAATGTDSCADWKQIDCEELEFKKLVRVIG